MPIDRTTGSYDSKITEASKSVLFEILTALRSHEDAIVLVGGWVPYFLLEEYRGAGSSFTHVGSIDIDLAVDETKITGNEYATIVELLKGRGFELSLDAKGNPIPNRFEKAVAVAGRREGEKIAIDFLTGMADPRIGKHRHRPVQDELFARKTRGCEAAFRHQLVLELTGKLPNGSTVKIPVRMADIVGCLAMKGIVLGERYKEKDAYDTFALVAHCEGGARWIADALRPCLNDPLVKEGVSKIIDAFRSRDANGPAWVADFLRPASDEERERIITDAFMTVHELDLLLFNPSPGAQSPGKVTSRDVSDWFRKHQTAAFAKFNEMGLAGFVEVSFLLPGSQYGWSQKDLLDVARGSEIDTFGMPIGRIGSGEEAPFPQVDGIAAELVRKEKEIYQYWALRRTGNFYLLESFFKKLDGDGQMSFNTRLHRIVEAFLYISRLYKRLGVRETDIVQVTFRHGGLKGRLLTAVGNRIVHGHYTATEPEVETTATVALGKIDADLEDLVKEVGKQLFVLFGFAEFGDSVYAGIVRSFIEGST